VYEQRFAYYLGAVGQTAVRRVALPGAAWLLAGIALLSRSRHRRLLLSVAALGELVAFGAGYNPAVAMTALPPAPDTISAVRRLEPAQQHLIASPGEVFPANLGPVYGVRDAVSYDALTSVARVEQLEKAGYDPVTHSFRPVFTPDEARALAGLGVRHVISRTAVPGARLVAGSGPPGAGVYQLDDAIPVAIPANLPPRGFFFGALISFLAAVASGAWLRLYTLAPVTLPQPSERVS
jgi:hypothetical protein